MLITTVLWFWVERDRTFIGIAIHNLSSSGEEAAEQSDLVAALKGAAAGILGTTVQMADLVCGILIPSLSCLTEYR
jgi:zinc transporter 7